MCQLPKRQRITLKIIVAEIIMIMIVVTITAAVIIAGAVVAVDNTKFKEG